MGLHPPLKPGILKHFYERRSMRAWTEMLLDVKTFFDLEAVADWSPG